MAVPKKKTSKSKNRMRQAGKGFTKKQNIFIDKDGKFCMSHMVIIKREKKQKNTEKSAEAQG